MNWIILVIMTAIFYGAYNVLIKISSGHINQVLGAVILQIVATLLGSCILLFLKISNHPIQVTSKGLWYAIFAGVAVGLAEVASFYAFSKGVPISVGLPIITGGSVLFGAAIGFLFLNESFSLVHFFAIFLIVVGTIILSVK